MVCSEYGSQISWRKIILTGQVLRSWERYCPFLRKPSMLKDNIDSHKDCLFDGGGDLTEDAAVEQAW